MAEEFNIIGYDDDDQIFSFFLSVTKTWLALSSDPLPSLLLAG